MGVGRAGGSFRHAVSVAIAVVTLALLACGTLTFLPHPYDNAPAGLKTPQDLARAYARIQPGTTRASELSSLGFDRTAANVQVLSYLGVLERFAADSRQFDRLNMALQGCIEARDRCTAFVFQTGDRHGRGDGLLASLGLGPANAASPDAQVTLLVLDGRVAYKAIVGVARALLAHSETPAVRRVSAMPAADRVVY